MSCNGRQVGEVLMRKIRKMEIEIKTSVTVRGNYGVDWITVVITENDLIELAKKKALESVDSYWYDTAECDEIDEVRSKH